jgi:hypothetical protein
MAELAKKVNWEAGWPLGQSAAVRYTLLCLGVALNGPEMPDVVARLRGLTGELVEPDPVSTGVGSR